MPFPAARNHRIALADAKIMTRRYRHSVPKGTFRAGVFPRSTYDTILAQAGCEGIRTYLGRHEDGDLNLILVGVDADLRDMVPGYRKLGEADTGLRDVVAGVQSTVGEEADGEIMQDSYPCPIFCDDGSPLNED